MSTSHRDSLHACPRAGRDGLPAECVLFFGRKDSPRLLNLMRRSRRKGAPSGAFQREVAQFNAMAEYCACNTECRHARVLAYFGEAWAAGRCGDKCDVCRGEVEPPPAPPGKVKRAAPAAARGGAAAAKQQGQRQLTAGGGGLAGAAGGRKPAPTAAGGAGPSGGAAFMSAAAALKQHQEQAAAKKPAAKKAPPPQRNTLLNCMQRAQPKASF
jgi:hypothetical protein